MYFVKEIAEREEHIRNEGTDLTYRHLINPTAQCNPRNLAYRVADEAKNAPRISAALPPSFPNKIKTLGPDIAPTAPLTANGNNTAADWPNERKEREYQHAKSGIPALIA